ncbi:MAG: SDR family oxidoreductase [Anaerolineaceae bacterium]|nr:MAG: SDR family oxidoreductase [Anaerolineaceae bacterium]
MTGKTVLITGATNGLGEVTARELARMGATVVIVGRNAQKAKDVTASITAETGNAKVDYIVSDLSVMAEIRDLADAFRAKYDRLDVLVNNAGMIFTSRELTPDGFEKTFALNHLSYFMLTNLLMDMLRQTGTPEQKARVVNVSSSAHSFGKLDFSNLNGEKSYNAMGAYGVSKLCNILFTNALARRLLAEEAPVTVNSLHPGIVRTGFGKNNDGLLGTLTRAGTTVLQMFGLSAEKGAETQIYLASSREVEGVSGQYFEKKKISRSNSVSNNEGIQERLWEVSGQMTGLHEAENVAG